MVTIDQRYIVPFGIIKGVEFLTILIGWSLFIDGRGGRVEYFIAVGIISWLFVIIWFILNIFKITDNISVSFKNVVFACFHFVLGILLLIGAIVITPFAGHWLGSSRIDAGVAFGYISAIVLLLDGAVHIVKGKDLYGGTTVTATTTITTS